MICPECGKAGFPSKALLENSNSLKCSECGEWSEPERWEKVKTGAEYRAEIKRLRSVMEDCVAGHDDCCNFICNKIKEALAVRG